MKKIIIIYFIPILFAIACLFCYNRQINSLFFHKEIIEKSINTHFESIPDFNDNEFLENQFINNNDSVETIFILGSSELTDITEAIPFNFISNHFKTKLIGVGHAGNQCFSIYSQLLAKVDRLNNAPIVIMLSPGWFHSTGAKGTVASLFLEYNSYRFLNAILKNDSSLIFRKYEAERISNYYHEIVNPDLSIKLFNNENQSSKSIWHKWFYLPQKEIYKTLNSLKLTLLETNDKTTNLKHINRNLIVHENISINWDSLFTVSKREQIKNSTNNKWYIDNNYYKKYINGKTLKVIPVKDENNQELKDFKMLMKLLKTMNVNASFIIMPLNPYCYTNSKELTPLINTLQTELNNNNYPYLNLWNPDSNNYDKGILKDVMHLSKYAWYKADKFIVETYKLTK